jgi:hypothetical protein
MVGKIQGGAYALNRGIQDILPFEQTSLPDKAALAPSDASRSARLNSLYAVRNCASLIASFLRPAVSNLETLSPERHRRNLRHCRESFKDSVDPDLVALANLLAEEGDQASLLASFQGLLLAG